MVAFSLGARVIWKAYKLPGRIVDLVGEQYIVQLDEPMFGKPIHKLFREELEKPLFTVALLLDGHREMSEEPSLTDSALDKVLFYIREDKFVQAIKEVRVALHISLLEAKTFVEALRDLHRK